MKIKSIFWSLSIALLLVACGPKDAEIEKDIIAKMGTMPGMQVTVKDGVATISGVCVDAACKESCENIAKGVKGVKSVVNNCEIAAPLPVQAPIEISTDDFLKTATAQIVSTYPGASATVSDGVITLTGEIKRDQLPGLIQSMQELKPKKVENQLTIK